MFSTIVRFVGESYPAQAGLAWYHNSPAYRKLQSVAASNREYMIASNPPLPLTLTLSSVSLGVTPIHNESTSFGTVDLWPLTTEQAILRCHRDTQTFGHLVALSFANADIPGGGYIYGAPTQEEELCRVCPTLWPSLRQSRYPFDHTQELKYTSNVQLCRDSSRSHLFLNNHERPCVDIVSAAAPDLGSVLGWITRQKWNVDNMERLLHSVYRAPLIMNQSLDQQSSPRTLIVGALGNGAYANEPTATALLFARITKQYQRNYSHIIFAIPEESSHNYQVYQRVLMDEALIQS